jgi:AraC-like DNA-binding protein
MAYNWLFQFTCISLGAHVFALSKKFMVYFAPPSTILAAYLLVSLSVLCVICWLVLQALHHPSISRGTKTESTTIKLAQSKHAKDSHAEGKCDNKSSVQPAPISADIQIQIDVIDAYMKSNEPYLEPDLSIENLALLLDTRPKELSTLINHCMGTNFFNYVNAYRIQKARSILSSPLHQKQSVLQTLYDVGFNSKSSFNTAFKKHTGQTPSAYRKKH